MTRGKVRCPIGVGHDEEEEGHDGGEGSAWHHTVIAWCYRHCWLDRQSGDARSGSGMTMRRSGMTMRRS